MPRCLRKRAARRFPRLLSDTQQRQRSRCESKPTTNLGYILRQVSPCGAGGPVIVMTATAWPHAKGSRQPEPGNRPPEIASSACSPSMNVSPAPASAEIPARSAIGEFRGFFVPGPCRWLKPNRSSHSIDFTGHRDCRCQRPSPCSVNPGCLVLARPSSSGFAAQIWRARASDPGFDSRAVKHAIPFFSCTFASGYRSGDDPQRLSLRGPIRRASVRKENFK